MHFKMSSAICFNSDQSNILSSGKDWGPYPKTKAFEDGIDEDQGPWL